MMKISNILNRFHKSTLLVVEANETVEYVLRYMLENDLGAVPIVKNGNLVGIFSERDYARDVCRGIKPDNNTRIDRLMKTRVIYVTPEYSLADSILIMRENKIGHLPVFENGKFISMLSIGIFTEALIDHQSFKLKNYRGYITGQIVELSEICDRKKAFELCSLPA